MDDNNKKVKLKFPLSFDLKVFMVAGNDDENQSVIINTLKELKIPSQNQDIRESSGAKYKRYSFKVTLLTKKRMDEMYSTLIKIPGVKTVL